MSALFSTDQISKLSDFLDALDEWGCEDNDELAEAIAEFAVGGFDLSAYEEGRPELRVIQGGRPEPSAPSPAGVEVVACNDIPEATWKRANEIANECYALWATRSGSFAGPIAQEIATLTASLDQATRRAEEAARREAAWEETRLANANLRNENGALRGRCSALEQALEDEREACAKIAETLPFTAEHHPTRIAKAIRAREALSSTASSITEKETDRAD